MQRIHFDEDIKPLSEFRANSTSYIQQVRDTGRPIIITQHGKSSAVLLDVSEYERLMEKLELLQEIRTAENQIDSGQGIENLDAKRLMLEKLKG